MGDMVDQEQVIGDLPDLGGARKTYIATAAPPAQRKSVRVELHAAALSAAVVNRAALKFSRTEHIPCNTVTPALPTPFDFLLFSLHSAQGTQLYSLLHQSANTLLSLSVCNSTHAGHLSQYQHCFRS